MEKMSKIKKAYRMNVVTLAKQHKRQCTESDCNVSLILLRKMCEEAGIKFTKKQKEIFT